MSLSEQVPQGGASKILSIAHTYGLLNRSELAVQSDYTKHHCKRFRTKKDHSLQHW